MVPGTIYTFSSMFLLLLAILTKADVPRVTAAELHAMLAKGDAVAVDVRGSVPYELGHLPGAIWMPLGVLPSRVGELPEDKLLVMYCTCKAEETSLEAAMLLAKGGFPRVAVLHGGYPAWTAAGFPTQSSRTSEMSVPAAVSCSSTLRKVSGPVTHYRRLRGKTVLTIGEETITLRHKGSDDPSRFFLVNGTPFVHNDWNRVEVRKGEARAGIQATAWLCADGTTTIDWLP
jgi:rhodanese-related sulfurtransferase